MKHISEELNIGRAGQYLVMADLLLKGVKVFSTAEGVNYDVVADVDNRLIRLQVKTTRKPKILRDRKKPIYFFQIKRAGKNGKWRYEVGEFECFALVSLDIKKVFYLKFDEKIGLDSICLRDRAIKYQREGLYYQDLTWENFLKKL